MWAMPLIAAIGAPLDPVHAARIMADYMMKDTHDAEYFKKWGYGQSIVHDALLLASEKVDGMDYVMASWVNPVLDEYLTDGNSAAYNLTHGISIDVQWIGNAVGDKIGLYGHAYLHRYLHYTSGAAKSLPPTGYNASADLVVARETVDAYILKWPRHWTDGTVTRDFGGRDSASDPEPWGNSSYGAHQYIWGDDSYMGLTLPSRMVVAGLDDAAGTYAQFVATQHSLFAHHLRPTAAEGGGIYWHGRDAKSGVPSCCKWGRANGWTMMTHVETLSALSASKWSGAPAALESANRVFAAHATAISAVQNKRDGRWHQLLDNSTMWLETSSTAMFAVAMVRGVDAGWLDAKTFNPVIALAWEGLSKAIRSDGFVAGQCDGFGIHSSPRDYWGCGQAYGKSVPGLGSVIKAAVLLASRPKQ